MAVKTVNSEKQVIVGTIQAYKRCKKEKQVTETIKDVSSVWVMNLIKFLFLVGEKMHNTLSGS